MLRIALVVFGVAGLALAQVSETKIMDFPTGGTLQLKRSIGLLTVEGWDQPKIEIVTIKTPESYSPNAERDAGRANERTKIIAEGRGNDVVVTTHVLQNFLLLRPFEGIRPVAVEYRIHAPRAARLNIDHRSGEVNIDGIAGDIHVTDGLGQINVTLPQGGNYAIDARSKLGAIDSDFAGQERKKLKFGHAFASPAESAAQRLFLRIGFGDIVMLKESLPELEPISAK
jgi:hypothetical protein